MKIVLRIAMITLSVVLGLVFIYSGWSKLDPLIETFEFTFVDIGVANWYTAPIMARLLIGLEFFVGLLLVMNYNLRKLTIPLTIGLLLFFCVYLLIQIYQTGNEGNCGCFGERLHMTPRQALIKNVIMIALCFPVMYLWEGWKTKFNKLLLSFIMLVSLTMPFILNYVDYTYSSNNLGEKVDYPLDMALLYKPEDTSKVQIPKVDLRTGKHVVAFMSLSCPHCRIAAKKFHLINKNNPQLPIYFILNGDKQKLEEFFKDTKCENIPWSMALGKTFVNLSGTHLPQIYYLENSYVRKKLDYFELNQYNIEDWLEGKGVK